jgi:RND family efflux transporter MFP subunit
MIISKKQHRYPALFAALLAALLCILLLPACDPSGSPSSDSKIATAKAQKKAHRIEVVTVKDEAIELNQTLSGTLEAVTKIRLYNEESGRITRLPYYEGDVVKKGTLLVQLDNELLKTDVAKATASKEQAELDLSRVKKLLPKKISTEEEVARARTEVDLATADAERQQTRLRRTSIRAPIDGLITKRLYEPGDMLAPQSHILTIIDPSELRLKADLAERWLPLVEKGQPVSLRIDALGDRRFSARINRVHPTIDIKTHKGKIEILLTPVPEGAVAGQLSRADIKLSVSSLLTIPVHTIHYDPEGAYVYRVDEDKDGHAIVKKVFIEQGQQYASVAEVLSGLKKDDRIVSRGILGLRDGKKVEIAGPVNADGDKQP